MQITRNIVFALLAIPSFLSAAQLGETYTQEVVAPTSNAAVEPVLMFSGVSLNNVKSVSAMFTKDQMDTEANTPTYTSEYCDTKSANGVVTNKIVRFQSYLGGAPNASNWSCCKKVRIYLEECRTAIILRTIRI